MAKELLQQEIAIEDIPAKDLAFLLANKAEDKKAIDARVYDLRAVTDMADYVIIASAESAAQMKAIANHVEDELSKLGVEPLHSEGQFAGNWILYDYGDVIINILLTEARSFYDLDGFWDHAMIISREEWSDLPAEAA